MPCEEFIPRQMRAFDLSLLPPKPNLAFELELWRSGITLVAGIDEAGRGALAGPVAAAAVILPPDKRMVQKLRGVHDSKQLTPEQREAARRKIINYAAGWGVGFASSQEIDQIGILPATRLAAYRALRYLHVSPAHLLIDYLVLPEVATPQTAIVKGDCRSLSIAAASILAKTTRDAFLCELDRVYPGFGFAMHKGYGTQYHRAAIRRLGTCPEHRLSFALLGDRDVLTAEECQELNLQSPTA